MSQKTIEIKSITSPHDYSAMKNYYLYKSRPKRTKTIAVILFFSFGLLLLSETAFTLSFFKPLGIFGMLIFAGFYFWIDHEGRILDKSAKFIISTKQELSLTEDGVSISWPDSGKFRKYDWKDINTAVESDGHFFLFGEPTLPAIVPKFELKEFRINEIRKFIESRTELLSDISGWKYQKI
ncbi:MAG: hypothetical protein EOM59_00260 [Clostridia bacterium]|nr:hypothetical protein [Clostridia bacterium]